MIRITYDPINGMVLPDGKVREFAQNLTKGGDEGSCVIGSGILIDAIRAEVVKGTYSHEDICFIFEGETILMNEYGRMANWPKGFNDMSMRICYDIIRGARDKRKKVS